MARALALAAALLLGRAAAAAPRIVPLERELERLSIGPTVSLEGALSGDGPGAGLSVGAAVVLYDRDAKTDPECEERRRKERAALGGETVKPWGDVVGFVQQPCPAISESWWPRGEARLEVGLGAWASKGGSLRISGGGIGWRWFLLGASAAGELARDGAGQALGLRVGPEVSAHFRFGRKGARPSLVVFARGEVAAAGRERFADRVGLGARYLFDW